jgi:hypothetical protein
LHRKALALVFVAFAGLAIYRGIHLWLTGFYVSDEFSYVMVAIRGTYQISYLEQLDGTYRCCIVSPFERQVSHRLFFLFVNSLMVRSLGIRTGSQFAAFLPFYLILWNFITIGSAYGIMRTIGLSPKAISFGLFCSLFPISFVVLDQGFLSETVSLSMAMLGIYLLHLYSKVETSAPLSQIRGSITGAARLILPIFAALAFGAAMNTREPYAIYLVAGWIPVLIISVRRFMNSKDLPLARRCLLSSLPPLSFVAASLVLLTYPRNTIASDMIPVLGKILASVPVSSWDRGLAAYYAGLSGPGLSGPTWLLSVVVPLTLIGLVIGWGPVLAATTIVGVVILLRLALRGRRNEHIMAFACASISIGLFVGTSAWMAPFPEFSFTIATILAIFPLLARYSQMATPAYFLGSPFFFSRLRRRGIGLLLAVLILFSFLAANPYQRYLEANLVNGYPYAKGQQIFSLDYRTPLARLRDHIASHKDQGPFIVLAEPDPRSYYDNFTLHWQMIPGTENLPMVQFYPYISEAELKSSNITTFYIYGEGNWIKLVRFRAPYLLQLIEGNATQGLAVKSRQVIYWGPDAVIIRIELLEDSKTTEGPMSDPESLLLPLCHSDDHQVTCTQLQWLWPSVRAPT